MPSLYRYKYTLTGFTGAPGYTSFYTDATAITPGALATFWGAIKDNFPQGTVITAPDYYDELDVATGANIGSGSAILDPPLTSAGAVEPYAGAAGCVVDWLCGPARIAGRKVRGRTFLVPLRSSFFTSAGTINSITAASIQTPATNLITACTPHLVVWSRPYAGRSLPLPAKPARAGSIHPIVTASVPLVQATLRSRRT